MTGVDLLLAVIIVAGLQWVYYRMEEARVDLSFQREFEDNELHGKMTVENLQLRNRIELIEKRLDRVWRKHAELDDRLNTLHARVIKLEGRMSRITLSNIRDGREVWN
jgi:hypothetical protein